MTSTNPMADRLRQLLASPEGIELPGCYDVLSAMILERAGFPAVFMSGYGAAASFLGNPDIGLTSLVETALITKNVAAALHVPLVVDADNGYGDEDSVVRTVLELERAGAAAIIQRGLLTGLSVILGFTAYALINKRLHLGGIFQLFSRRPATVQAIQPAPVHT